MICLNNIDRLVHDKNLFSKTSSVSARTMTPTPNTWGHNTWANLWRKNGLLPYIKSANWEMAIDTKIYQTIPKGKWNFQGEKKPCTCTSISLLSSQSSRVTIIYIISQNSLPISLPLEYTLDVDITLNTPYFSPNALMELWSSSALKQHAISIMVIKYASTSKSNNCFKAANLPIHFVTYSMPSNGAKSCWKH